MDSTADDDLIGDMIAAARSLCEEHTRRQFLTATWLFTVKRFPWRTGTTAWTGATARALDGQFRADQGVPLSGWTLPRPPLQSVSWVKYYDTSNVLQTLSTALYGVDAGRDPGLVYLAPFQLWPASAIRPDAVQVQYAAGYGDDSSAAPKVVKQAIRFTLSNWYVNRNVGQALPDAVKLLLDAVWNGALEVGEVKAG